MELKVDVENFVKMNFRHGIHCMELKESKGEARSRLTTLLMNPLHGVESAYTCLTASVQPARIVESIAWS